MVEGVSIPLALEDAVPVALSTAGFLVLAGAVRERAGAAAGRAAVAAALLIGAGGAAKVSWKLVAAFAGRDVVWLDDLLFPLLAVGFAGMVASLAAARRAEAGTAPAPVAMAVVAAVVALAVAADPDVGLPVARWLAVVGSLTASWLLVAVATGAGDRVAVGLVAANVVATLVLAGLARVEPQTLGLQWVEQSVNTASQAAFLVAAVRIAAVPAWGRRPSRRRSSVAF